MTASAQSRRTRPIGLGDAAAFVGFVLCGLILLPGWEPHPAVLAAAGTAVLLSSLRSLPGDGRASRPARATAGALIAFWTLGGGLRFWPLDLLAPLLTIILFGWMGGWLGELRALFARGRLGTAEWIGIVAIAVAAAVALLGWVWLTDPDLSKLQLMIPALPLSGLVAAAVGFAALNAMMEEAIWRGAVQGWLLTVLPPWAAVTLQALSFGVLHWNGFPSGLIGVGLAATYGAMLGVLALRSGGLLAAIITHFAADMLIFSVLALQA